MRNRRRCFRIPVRGSRRNAVLEVDRRRVPVQVRDESAEGFAVAASRDPRVQAGDVVRLRTESGWSEVQVVHVDSGQPAGSDGDPQAHKGQPAFRLGLKRLRDLPAPEDQPTKISWTARPRHAALVPSTVPTVVQGVLFTLIVVGIPAVAIGLLWHFRDPLVRQLGRWVDRFPVPSPPKSSGPPNQDLWPDWNSLVRKPAEAAERLASDPGSSSEPEDSTGSTKEDLPAVIRRLPGATAFLLDEVVEALELTDSQQNEIRRIFDSTAEAIRKLQQRRPYDTRQERAGKRDLVFQESQRSVLKLLTDKQRAQWDALRADPAQEPEVQEDDGPEGTGARQDDRPPE